MINHYYTLYQIVQSLNEKLKDAEILECFTQEKDEVIILFANDREVLTLCINLSANEQAIYLRDNFSRARSNSRNLFPEIISSRFLKIDIQNNDRVLFLRLSKKDIVINLAAASEHNMLILNKEHKITSSLYKTKELVNTQYEMLSNPLPAPVKENFNTIGKLLTNSDILLPRTYANELLSEYGLDAKTPLDEVSQLDEIIIKAQGLRHDALNSGKYYLYVFEDNTAIFSLIPLLDSTLPKPNTFDDIHGAIARRSAYQKKSEATQISKGTILKKLNTLKRKIEKHIEICQQTADLEVLTEKYKTYADVLMSSGNPNKRIGKALDTYDWYGNAISIPLEEKMTLIENSERYYGKIRKIKADIQKREEMLPKLERKLTHIDELIANIDSLTSSKEVKKYINTNINANKDMNKAINQGEATKFREFDLGEGYTLYVGRSAANNDELTMKFGKANDVWLHARGAAGSHAILRGPDTKETKPPKNILKVAAGVAAYYSKQKNAKMVPVSYTFKKYVHKRKGAAAGAVVMQREDVVFAEPKLPAGTDEV